MAQEPAFARSSNLRIDAVPSDHRHLRNVVERPVEIRIARAGPGKVGSYRGHAESVGAMRSPVVHGPWAQHSTLLNVIGPIELQRLDAIGALVCIEPTFREQRAYALNAVLNAQARRQPDFT